MKNIKQYSVHIVWALVAIVLLVGGIVYGKSTSSSASTFAGRAGSASSTRTFAGRGGATGGGFVSGQVISVDSTSITLQLANGNSEVVFYSTSTAVTKPTTVTIASITPGTNVMIGGSQNSDGSLTAQSIQVRAAMTSSTSPRPDGQ